MSISAPILAGLSVTITPAFSRAATLSEAAPKNRLASSDQREATASLTLPARDDGTGVAHTTSRRCSTTSNKSYDRLGVLTRLVVLFQVLSGFLLHGTTDLTNDDDAFQKVNGKTAKTQMELITFRGIVLKENLDDINMLCAGEWVTANANA